jgi:hypothetical protein
MGARSFVRPIAASFGSVKWPLLVYPTVVLAQRIGLAHNPHVYAHPQVWGGTGVHVCVTPITHSRCVLFLGLGLGDHICV